MTDEELKNLEDQWRKGMISTPEYLDRRNRIMGVEPIRYFPEPEKKPFPRALWTLPVIFGLFGAIIAALIVFANDYKVSLWEMFGLGFFMSFVWCAASWLLFVSML
jgi:hypothetical protein